MDELESLAAECGAAFGDGDVAKALELLGQLSAQRDDGACAPGQLVPALGPPSVPPARSWPRPRVPVPALCRVPSARATRCRVAFSALRLASAPTR